MKPALRPLPAAVPAQAGDAGGTVTLPESRIRLLAHSPTTRYALEVQDALTAELRRLGPRFSTPQFLADWGDRWFEWFELYGRNARQLYDALRALPNPRLTISYRSFARHVRAHRQRLAAPSLPVQQTAAPASPLALLPAPAPLPDFAVPPAPPAARTVATTPTTTPPPAPPIIPRAVSVRSVIPTAPPRPVDPDQGKTLDDHLVEFVNDPSAGRVFVADLRERLAARNADRLRQIEEAEAKGLPHPIFTD